MSDAQQTITVGVLKETWEGERRVALVPDVLSLLERSGVKVVVETGAGVESGILDADYEAKGARIIQDRKGVFDASDVIVKVRGLGADTDGGSADLDLMRDGQTLIAAVDPLSEPLPVQVASKKNLTVFSMEMMPRITRAQSMDILSSMATVAGYKAVLLAADTSNKMFPMMMTAAGTIAPAHVFVIGAGVAGLQAIATAKRLGAVVSGYDVRPAVREQVESLGAKFVEFELETKDSEDSGGYAKAQGEEFYRKQREMMAKVVAKNDVVITTAAIPGKKSPILITEEMVKGMALGSVIVDLAAERGGNCELTQSGEIITVHGVTIIGSLNLPSTIPYHASRMYAKNITTFLQHLVKEGTLELDLNDEIVQGTLMAHQGDVPHPRIRELLELAPLPTENATEGEND